MARRKTWCEKLKDSKDLPRVLEIGGKMSRKWGTGTVVIMAPVEVDEFMRKVPERQLATINEIRGRLPKRTPSNAGQYCSRA